MRFILEKFNQAEKLDGDGNNKTPLRGSRNYDFNSAKKSEDEYNDFEENISIGSNN